MTNLIDTLEHLGTVSVEAVWLPLAAWTLVAGPAYLALRRRQADRPVVAYRAYLALVLALPLGLSWAALPGFSPVMAPLATILLPGVELQPWLTMPAPSPWTLLPTLLLGVFLLAAAAHAAWELCRLGWHAVVLAGLPRVLTPAPASARRGAQRLAAQHGVRSPVRLYQSDRCAVPMTFGWRRPAIVLPTGLLGDEEGVRLTLAHELVHIRRGDYAWHGIERVIGALFGVHPLVRALLRQLRHLRELCCDAEVLAGPGVDRQRYAALLLCFASPPAPTPLALGMADDPSNLKTRILAMNATKLTQRPVLSLALAALLASLAVVVVACSDTLFSAGQETASEAALAGDVYAVADQMPTLAPDNATAFAALAQEIKYPRLAQQAGIEGRVVVQFVVDEKGHVNDPVVLQGIGAGCDEEAVRAIQKTLSFTPAMQDGQPVKVKMTLPVTFKLPEAPAGDA